MRIVAGKHKGRRVETPEGRDVRPTAARTREAVFNILLHGNFPSGESPLIGKRVADIFSGSGAMGLEALSRGAAHVTFVDKSRDAIAAVEYNIGKFGEQAASRVLRADSSQLPPAHQPFDLLLLDPPYRTGLAVASLQTALAGGWLQPDGVVVLEQSFNEPVVIPDGFAQFDERKYGNTRILLLALA